jgi:hypothetical protein
MGIPDSRVYGPEKEKGGNRKEGIGKDMGIPDSRVYGT